MGSSGGGQRTPEQLELERRQLDELRQLERVEARKKQALRRGRSGRRSLFSGSERGITDSLVTE